MQVTDNKPPAIADIKRQLKVAEHELDELSENTPGHAGQRLESTKQALYRVREAISHLETAERQQ